MLALSYTTYCNMWRILSTNHQQHPWHSSPQSLVHDIRRLEVQLSDTLVPSRSYRALTAVTGETADCWTDLFQCVVGDGDTSNIYSGY